MANFAIIPDALQAGASQFEQAAGKLKNKMWWKNMKVCFNCVRFSASTLSMSLSFVPAECVVVLRRGLDAPVHTIGFKIFTKVLSATTLHYIINFRFSLYFQEPFISEFR